MEIKLDEERKKKREDKWWMGGKKEVLIGSKNRQGPYSCFWITF